MKHSSRKIGSILEKVLKDLNADDQLIKTRILSEWDNLFGTNIGKFCHPVQFTRDDILELEAISESWKKELEKEKYRIMKELKNRFHQLKIKDIKII